MVSYVADNDRHFTAANMKMKKAIQRVPVFVDGVPGCSEAAIGIELVLLEADILSAVVGE